MAKKEIKSYRSAAINQTDKWNAKSHYLHECISVLFFLTEICEK